MCVGRSLYVRGSVDVIIRRNNRLYLFLLHLLSVFELIFFSFFKSSTKKSFSLALFCFFKRQTGVVFFFKQSIATFVLRSKKEAKKEESAERQQNVSTTLLTFFLRKEGTSFQKEVPSFQNSSCSLFWRIKTYHFSSAQKDVTSKRALSSYLINARVKRSIVDASSSAPWIIVSIDERSILRLCSRVKKEKPILIARKT